ncbi:beta-lactamase domain-containing protein [Amycolatopsis decaplanina DSM 44594]|uniref:Beta-lactamase domain-containing protein n=1 Tax=Amycolatopsis decaplanina DSM 44594 TaxID=1284240 RepID=M2XQP1_9PSEU|nr:beta-lactamase domain-containing protein [Amycolatopsis decaplanina DSM 44594]
MTSIFFGASTVHVFDGVTSILVDGFFSRPSWARILAGKVAPDQERITAALERGGIDHLDALFVAHSHHDHVMDAPDVVRLRGGTLYGSPSTLNVGRGAGLPDDSMCVIADGDQVKLGDFTVRVFEGRHSPGDHYPGTIDEPLTTPAKASAYRTGGCYSFLLTHSAGRMLVHPSANFVPHQFDGLDVDFLYLGVGALGAQDKQFQDDYWHHVVEATSPSFIVPVHWDDFSRPLGRPLRTMPFFLDKAARTKDVLIRKAGESRIPWRFQDAFEIIRPFDGPNAANDA